MDKKDLGTDTTTAISIFLTQAVATNGFPFEIKRQIESNPYAPMTEAEMQILWFLIWGWSMDYKIVLMRDAEENLDRFITYRLFEKKS